MVDPNPDVPSYHLGLQAKRRGVTSAGRGVAANNVEAASPGPSLQEFEALMMLSGCGFCNRVLSQYGLPGWG